MAEAIWIKQIKSQSKCTEPQLKTLRAIGLKGLNSEAVRQDTHAMRGMLNKVHHLVNAKLIDPSKIEKTKANDQRGYTLG